MKQLLHSFATSNGRLCAVVALRDRAFFVVSDSSTVFELPPLGISEEPSQQQQQQQQQQQEATKTSVKNEATAEDGGKKSEEQGGGPGRFPNDIQAVAGTTKTSGSGIGMMAEEGDTVLVAVARANKFLSIYSLFLEQTISSSSYLGDNNNNNNNNTPNFFGTVKVLSTIVHRTAKRVSSVCFATIPSFMEPGGLLLHVVITGDLVGDAVAYSVEPDPTVDTNCSSTTAAPPSSYYKESEEDSTTTTRRLLLGHTASMLTAVEIAPGRIKDGANTIGMASESVLLTADRDEKIRVTHFPVTTHIHGFLLGHEAFVSAVAVVVVNNNNNNNNLCVSCGGDQFLRVWDYIQCRQLASIDLAAGPERAENNRNQQQQQPENETSSKAAFGTTAIPIKVAITYPNKQEQSVPLVFYASIIYDDCCALDIFRIECSENGDVTIDTHKQIQLPRKPLAIVPWMDTRILVLLNGFEFLLAFSMLPGENDTVVLKGLESPQTIMIPREIKRKDPIVPLAKLELVDSIMEKDKHGNLTMSKNMETRGPALNMPWNDASRRETARTRNKRGRENRKRKMIKGAEEEGKDEEGKESEATAANETQMNEN